MSENRDSGDDLEKSVYNRRTDNKMDTEQFLEDIEDDQGRKNTNIPVPEKEALAKRGFVCFSGFGICNKF